MGLKEAYVEKREAQLKACDAEIQKLEAQAAQAKADARIMFYEQLHSLYLKRDRARAEMRAVKSASADAWENLKTGLEDAWDDLKVGMKGALAKFRKA